MSQCVSRRSISAILSIYSPSFRGYGQAVTTQKARRRGALKQASLLAGVVLLAWLAHASRPVHADGLQDRRAASSALARGQLAEAVKLATRALKSGQLTDLQAADALSTRSNAYRDQGNHKAAQTDSNRVVEICSRLIRSGRLASDDLSIAYNLRGMVNVDRKRRAEAIADFTASIRADPSMAQFALFNRSQLYLNLRRYELAAADAGAILNGRPNELVKRRALYNRARIFFYLGRYDDALADYDRALPISGDDRWKFLIGRANVRYVTGDYRGAIADYRQSLSLSPVPTTRTKLKRARQALQSEGASREATENAVWERLLSAGLAPEPR